MPILPYNRSQLVNYNGDLMTPPDQRNKAKTTILSKKGGKTIKGGRRTGKYADDDSSDDNDWWFTRHLKNTLHRVAYILILWDANWTANYCVQTMFWKFLWYIKYLHLLSHNISNTIFVLLLNVKYRTSQHTTATSNSFRVSHGKNVYSPCKYINSHPTVVASFMFVWFAKDYCPKRVNRKNI